MGSRLRFLPLVLALLPSCATRPELFNTWVDPDHPAAPLKGLLVVAVARDTRSVWEDEFAGTLKMNGVDATASYRSMPELGDSVAVWNLARESGCDGILVIYPHPREWRTVFEEGYTDLESQEVPKPPRFPGDFSLETEEELVDVYYPFEEHDEIAALCDVDVWTREDSRMVWTGSTEMINPVSYQHTAYRTAAEVVHDLSRCGIIPAGL